MLLREGRETAKHEEHVKTLISTQARASPRSYLALILLQGFFYYFPSRFSSQFFGVLRVLAVSLLADSPEMWQVG